MSIKTIDTESIGTDTGMSKKINKGAEKLIFDILQATQYSTPIPSTVRELVTNACDSQREKEIAIEILTGQKKIEDYYIERHGEQYEDSNFKTEYYNLESFSSKNYVEIVYKKNEGVGYCDEFSIIDYGVGIGGRRLEGVLELGYSTKRNTSQNFGAFGLGAKVALSTGVPYYTIETVYQGKRFKVNCYSYMTEFVIPKFNTLTGGINPSITLSDGTIVYYEPTTEKNFTKVSFGVKKHNYQRFRDAVSEQLTYFENVNFKVIDENNSVEQVNFRSPMLYSSDNIIVSESRYFNKPHIVIVKDKSSDNGINYGHIDFKELEMEQLYGAIGLKCPIRQSYIDESGQQVVLQEGVEVTPSREKVIWNDSTKQYIQKVINEAADEVTSIIETELNEPDFIKWLVACRDVLFNTTNSKNVDENKRTVLSTLSNIIDTTNLKPKYTVNPKIKFNSIAKLLCGFKVVRKSVQIAVKDGNKSITIKSEDITEWNEFNTDRLYVKLDGSTHTSRLKDYYLTGAGGNSLGESIIVIYPKSLEYLENKINDPDSTQIDIDTATAEYNKLVNNVEVVGELLSKSILFVDYDAIDVPDSVSLSLTKQEELTEEDYKKLGINETPEEKRLRNSEIVIHGIRKEDGRNSILDKVEPKLQKLIDSTIPSYYSTNADKEDLLSAFSMMENFYLIPRQLFNNAYWDSREVRTYWEEVPVQLKHNSTSIRQDLVLNVPQLFTISETNEKHIKLNSSYKHIDQFFYDVKDDGTLTAHNMVRLAFTVHTFLDSFNATSNYFDYSKRGLLSILASVNPVFNSIQDLLNYIHTIRYSKIPKKYLEMYKKWGTFQKILEDGINDDSISTLSESLCIFTDIRSVDIYDKEILDIMQYTKSILDMVYPLINALTVGEDYSNLDLNKELEFYLTQRGIFNVDLPGDSSSLNELDTKVKSLITKYKL